MNAAQKSVIEDIHKISNLLPGVIIINDVSQNKVAYMSQRGLDILRVTFDELDTIGSDYFFKYFNEEDVAAYYPKYLELMENNNLDDKITFFQQVRSDENDPWVWYLSVTKILLKENDLPSLSITVTQPVTELANITNKLDKLMEEHLFLKQSLDKLSSLSSREKQVLQLLALGKKNEEISAELFISINTAKTHRKKIKEKLDAFSTIELHKYASAFNLI